MPYETDDLVDMIHQNSSDIAQLHERVAQIESAAIQLVGWIERIAAILDTMSIAITDVADRGDDLSRAPLRGTPEHPCEDCGQTDQGMTLDDGWYRCNACGFQG